MNKFDLVSKRDTSLDLAKGIGIILVVIGHCLNTKSIPGIIIYSFHMPLFFVISGLLFNINKNGHFIPFLFKKTRTLIVPAFFFTCIAIVVDYFFYGTTEMLHNLLWKGLPVPLWFLLDLFLVEILYWPLSKYNGKHNHLEIAIIAIFLLIGIISSKYNFYNPYSLCTVFTAVSFYAIGAWSQDYFFQLNIKINLQSVGIMLVLSIGYIVLLFSGGGGIKYV